MKHRNKCLLLCCLIAFSFVLPAQRGFFIPSNQRSVDIPFEYNNNFIILQIVVNGRMPLRFILDTGAGHTLITQRELSGFLGLQFEREFQVLGSDLTQPLVAHLARKVRFDLATDVTAPEEDILVLDKDMFHFEEFTGISVQGILSANVFSRYIMKINYDRSIITLYDRTRFGKSDVKGYTKQGLEVFREKPYLYTQLNVAADTVVPVKLLIDTGAAMPLLLFANTHPLLQPPPSAIFANIGFGLGGDLEGFTGRVKGVKISGHQQQNVVTYFQVLDTLVDSLAFNSRNGVIGNPLLNRFIVVLDYHNQEIWLKPSKKFKEEFIFDRSGMGIMLSGAGLNQFVVHHVLPKSPASEAGILKGDKILKVGKKSTKWMTLSGLLRRFQADVGKKVKVEIERDGEKMIKTVVLRELL